MVGRGKARSAFALLDDEDEASGDDVEDELAVLDLKRCLAVSDGEACARPSRRARNRRLSVARARARAYPKRKRGRADGREACARPARATRSLRAPSRHDFDAHAHPLATLLRKAPRCARRGT